MLTEDLKTSSNIFDKCPVPVVSSTLQIRRSYILKIMLYDFLQGVYKARGFHVNPKLLPSFTPHGRYLSEILLLEPIQCKLLQLNFFAEIML